MNLQRWNKMKQPPASALKQIQAGRLKGKSDINPQWRYQIMTEIYGECGVGWKFTVDKLWTEIGMDGVVFAFALVSVFTCDNKIWSSPIQGVGGSKLIEKESNGMHNNDEAFKMATTDALSVALKFLGVASDVYMGLWDGSKYKDIPESKEEKKQSDDVVFHSYKKELKEALSLEHLKEIFTAINLSAKKKEITEIQLTDLIKIKDEAKLALKG